MAHKIHFDLYLDDNYLKAIGQAVMQWAYFEQMFNSLIYEMELRIVFTLVEKGKTYSGVVQLEKLRDFDKRRMHFISLIKHVPFPPVREQMRDLAKKSSSLNKIRGQIAHSVYYPKKPGKRSL